MKNLLKAIDLEAKTRRDEFIKGLAEIKDVKSILDVWYYRHHLTKSKQIDAPFMGLDQLKEVLIKRFDKEQAKSIAEKVHRIGHIAEAKEVDRINITVEWRKNRTWGANPFAEARVSYLDGTCDHFNSGSIGGCGFDKESTAVANCINQVNGILKKLYIKKDKKTNKANREIFGYGSGSGLLPNLEGGVGVSCYPRIFEKIGYNFRGVSHGKTFDVYEIVKK